MRVRKLLGLESDDDSEPKIGLVWAEFERKYETWHYGPEDEKDVVYDGMEKDRLYRFVDDRNDTVTATSYNRELRCNYELELITENIDEKWKEKRKQNKKMYLVAEGSWDGDNLRYSSPVLVVDKPTFDKLKDKATLPYSRSIIKATPRNLHQNVRRNR